MADSASGWSLNARHAGNPELWANKLRKVILLASTVPDWSDTLTVLFQSSGSSYGWIARGPWNSGSTVITGSSTDTFPRSTRVMNAVVVNNLVMDARSKSVSASTGRDVISGSRNPIATSCTIALLW